MQGLINDHENVGIIPDIITAIGCHLGQVVGAFGLAPAWFLSLW